MARPTRDLTRSIAFYRDHLGLRPTGGFCDHDGYDGAFFALPGGGELELTAGPVAPGAPTDDDLLVLYVADRTALAGRVDALAVHGIASAAPANPYWTRVGHTVLDPDGYRVVIALRDPEPAPATTIDWCGGARAELRALFELAEDSPEQLAGYLDQGRVLVARRDDTVVGHLQLVATDIDNEVELKSMAVRADLQGTGIGRKLVDEALARSARAGFTRMLVATAAADVGNLRFYQRVGFRMRGVDRDAFTPDTGYPEQILIDGIELRDRVWFDCTLTIGGFRPVRSC